MMWRAYLRRRVLAMMVTACVLVPGAALAQDLTEHVAVGDARLDVTIDAALARAKPDLLTWVRNSADTIATFYGQFPTRAVDLRLHGRPGRGVQGGVTTNTDGARISVRVGVDVTPAELANDWVLVHEMVHLALPEVGRRHGWLSEGLATYVEGIARAQAGRRSTQDVWTEYTESMPAGVPKSGEGGLDQTHTWARTYWGGALFCLVADVTIREQTKNQYSLRDALRAILKATGGYASGGEDARIEDVLKLGDAATRTTVLSDLYNAWKEKPVDSDLPRLWQRLGVRREGATVSFDDQAPLAAVRAAMTARK